MNSKCKTTASQSIMQYKHQINSAWYLNFEEFLLLNRNLLSAMFPLLAVHGIWLPGNLCEWLQTVSIIGFAHQFGVTFWRKADNLKFSGLQSSFKVGTYHTVGLSSFFPAVYLLKETWIRVYIYLPWSRFVHNFVFCLLKARMVLIHIFLTQS